MTSRSRLIRTIPLKNDPEGRSLEVSFSYQLGGANYFTGKNDPRGYFLSVTPISRSEGFVCVTLFSGIKALVEPAERFTQSKLDKLVVDETLVEKLVRVVCSKNSLTLAD